MYVTFLNRKWTFLVGSVTPQIWKFTSLHQNRTCILFVNLFTKWTKELKILYIVISDWFIIAVFISEKEIMYKLFEEVC